MLIQFKILEAQVENFKHSTRLVTGNQWNNDNHNDSADADDVMYGKYPTFNKPQLL